MNEFYKNVLTLLSKSLNNEKIETLPNWKETLQELKDQTVFCLPYKTIVESNLLSLEELMEYKMLCFQNIAHSHQLLHAQSKMLELFKDADIPLVVLKGAAAAMYYPHPEYRTMGDVDIIVKPEDFNRAYELLKQHYTIVQDLDTNKRHVGYVGNNNFKVELHQYFSYGERTKEKKKLDQLIYDAIDKCEYHSIESHSFPCLPTLVNGVVLLNHIAQHFQLDSIGIRQIIDFREYLNQLENIDSFINLTDKLSLSTLAKACIYICKEYLGLNILYNVNIKKEIPDYILSQLCLDGNFGKKSITTDTKKSEILMKKNKNLFMWFRTLQTHGRTHWKASEKYKILRPFAWIYQIIYYIKQVINNRGIHTIVDGYRNNKKKEKVMKDLHLK